MTQRKDELRAKRAKEIREIELDDERYDALVEFITPEYTDNCRWSIETIADIANEYIDTRRRAEILMDDPSISDCEYSLGYCEGEALVLGEMLSKNGLGWVVGIE